MWGEMIWGEMNAHHIFNEEIRGFFCFQLDLNDLPDNERAAALNGNKSPGGTRMPEVTQSVS